MEFTEEVDTVKSWIKDLSVILKLELNLDSEGICSFQIGEDTVIILEVSHDFPMLHIYSPLVPFPKDDVDGSVLLMAKALELNAFQTLTRGGAIAAIPGEGMLIFCYTTPIEGGSSELLSKILGSFYETVVEIKEILLESSDLSARGNERSIADEPKKRPLGMIKV
ncbi:MAG: CesT family type III secretion system chaperone [Parachlamydiaceae bacterium]|nr:CesT family type III secretion system chaperone [Parachlamydiaceae bacterium]